MVSRTVAEELGVDVFRVLRPSSVMRLPSNRGGGIADVPSNGMLDVRHIRSSI